MKLNGFVLDVEANGFYFQSTLMWIIHLRDLYTGEKLSIYPFKDVAAPLQFDQWMNKYTNPLVVFHNGLGYDIFAMRKHLGINFTVGPDTINEKPVRFVDTFYLSMFLNPDRQGHGIEPWGERLGLQKIDWRGEAIKLGLIDKNAPDGAEFMQWHPQMGVYCERDVEVNVRVFLALLDEWRDAYGEWTETLPQHFKCGQKSFYLMSCQALCGWKFDKEKALALKERIAVMMEEIRAATEPKLPPRPLKKGEQNNFTIPAKPWKKDGTFSSHMLNFIEKHNAEVIDSHNIRVYGMDVEIESRKILDVKVPMEMGNQDDMKEWFLEMGWEPVFWNYKKGPDGKPERDSRRQLIPTSPKIQEQGKICPNLLAMEGDIVKDVVKWLSLRNRAAVLESWINNPRLEMDGRLPTDRTGIAATHRQKHKIVVNVPKASEKVLLGKEFRELFTSEEGFKIAAGDAAALEGRVQGHYTFKYDGGATAKELLEGDPHSKNVVAFYWDDEPVLHQFNINDPAFDKEHPIFKPFRDRSKNG